MVKPLCVLLTVVSLTAAVSANAGVLGRAGDALSDGDVDAAEALIKRYVAEDPSGYLANDALEGLYLLRVKGVEGEVAASFLYGLDALDGGNDAAARDRLTTLAEDEDLPWAVRGRAAILVAGLTYYKRADEILTDVWAEADDQEMRKAAVIALVGLYRDEGRDDDAAELAAEYSEAFPDGPHLFEND